jgi:hypothetical protein
MARPATLETTSAIPTRPSNAVISFTRSGVRLGRPLTDRQKPVL